MIFAFAVLILALVAHTGVYFYKESLGEKIKLQSASFDKAQNEFDPSTLLKLVRTEKKMTVAKELIASHVSLSPLFDLLSESTLHSVRFKTFTYKVDHDRGKIALRMTGEALNYSSIALQSDSFGETKKFQDIVFSDLNLDSFGRVIFTFTASVDLALVSYRATLAKKQTP